MTGTGAAKARKTGGVAVGHRVPVFFNCTYCKRNRPSLADARECRTKDLAKAEADAAARKDKKDKKRHKKERDEAAVKHEMALMCSICRKTLQTKKQARNCCVVKHHK